MNLYPTISFFRASGNSSTGTPISLAEFMAKGTEYKSQIEEYRQLKKGIIELKAKKSEKQQLLATTQEVLDLGINPLDPKSEIAYHLAKKNEMSVAADIANYETIIASEEKRANAIKRSLPAATLSGYFYPKRKETDLQQHSGFICIDIDDHFNRKNSAGKNVSFPQSLDHVMDVLQQLPWVLYAAHSVGGSGYFVIIPLGPVVSSTMAQSCDSAPGAGASVRAFKTHKWYFECLEEEFREYGLIIDPACSDVTRLRIISYDEHPYRNPKAVPYMGRYGFVGREEKQRREDEARRAAEAAAHRARLNKTQGDVINDMERCVQQIEQQALDITSDYLTTVKIGMSLYSLGDSGLYLWKRICRFRSSDHAHLRTDVELEQHWRRFGSGKTVPVEWLFKYLIDKDSHPAWAIYAHQRSR